VLGGCIAVALVAGVFGESVAMIGHTADGVGTVIIMAALWWASGPLATLLRGGSSAISTSETIAADVAVSVSRPICSLLSQVIRGILRGPSFSGNNVPDEVVPLAVLAGGAAIGAALSTGAAAGDDELWCAPLRGWVCTAAAFELLSSTLLHYGPPAEAGSRSKKTR
jgi:hypothetical protein